MHLKKNQLEHHPIRVTKNCSETPYRVMGDGCETDWGCSSTVLVYSHDPGKEDQPEEEDPEEEEDLSAYMYKNITCICNQLFSQLKPCRHHKLYTAYHTNAKLTQTNILVNHCRVHVQSLLQTV